MAPKKKEDLMRGPKLDEKPKLKKTAPYGGKGEYDLAKEMMKKRAADKKGSYSPAPMTAKKKETIRRAAEKKQAATNIKKDLTKVAGVAGKVAGKVTRTAKNVAKAELGAAKTAAGFAVKAAKFNSDMVLKGAKAGAKALAKEPRLKREFKMGGSIKSLKESSDKASKKK